MLKNTYSPNFNVKYDQKINNLHFLADTLIISKNYEKMQSDGSTSPRDSTKGYSNHSQSHKDLSNFISISKKKFCVEYVKSTPKNNSKNNIIGNKNNVNNVNNVSNSSQNLLNKKRKRDSKIFSVEKIKKTLTYKKYFFTDNENSNNIILDNKEIKNKISNTNKNIKNNKNFNNNIVFNEKKIKNITNNSNDNIINKFNSNNDNNSDNLNNQKLNNKKVEDNNSENLNNVYKNNSQIKTETSSKQKEKQIKNDGTNLKEYINSKYSDEQYEKDMEFVNKDKKLKFMRDNFPIMFQKDKYYQYTIYPKQKKENINNYYILSNFFKNCNTLNYNKTYDYLYENKKYIDNNILISNKNNNKNIFNIYKTQKKNSKKNSYNILPKKVWSLNDESIKINIEKFFDDCINIWEFNNCCFIKEIALEFLMLNEYKPDICFKKIDQFQIFMKLRAKELDFPIISNTDKIIKKYNLRKTNNN